VHKLGATNRVELTRIAIAAGLVPVPNEDPRKKPQFLHNLRERLSAGKQAQEALTFIDAGISVTTGAEFFTPLVQCLATALQVDLAIAAKLTDSETDKVEILACSCDSQCMACVECSEHQKPCLPAVHQLLKEVDQPTTEHIWQVCPCDEGRFIHGLPLVDGCGHNIGLLALFHSTTVDDKLQPDTLLRILGLRASAELQRMNADEELRRAHDALEDTVRLRTKELTDTLDALRESEERYRTLVEQASDGIILTDIHRGFLSANSEACVMFGYTQKEILQKTVYDVIPPEELERNPLQIEALQAGQTVINERLYLRKNGTTFPVETSVKQLSDGSVLAIMRDITERKRTEGELKTAHAKLEATLNALPDLLFETDTKGHILDFRAPHPERLYAPPETFLGKTVAEVLPESAASIIEEAMRIALETGRSEGATYALQMPDKTRWFELSIARREDPGTSAARLVVLARDITDRKQVEQALYESEEKFRQIYDNVHDGILVAHVKKKYLLMGNETICRMLGYTHDEITTMSVTDIHPPQDFPRILKLFGNLDRGKTDIARNIPVLRKNGEVFHANISVAHTIINGELYVIGIFRETHAPNEK